MPTISRVTNDLYLGRFASRKRVAELREHGITDILNVSDTPSELTVDDGPFRSIDWITIEDRVRIPTDDAIKATNAIHRMLSIGVGRAYVHCMAGWNRSPTILWLYLIACDVHPGEASQTICSNAFDAVPGHPLLVDSNLIDSMRAFGRANYDPHPRPASIAPPTASKDEPDNSH